MTKKEYFPLRTPPELIPDITEALGMFKKIEEDVKDGKVGPELWSIVNLIFHTGLEKREICNLKIQNVALGNTIVNQIAINPAKSFQLPPEVKEILNDYVQKLQQSKGSSITPGSPLFPNYAGVNERQLTRHLNRYGNFNYLRSGGVKYFYETVMRRGPFMDEAKEKAVNDTALRFQIDKKTVKSHLDWFYPGDSEIFYEARSLTEYEILLDNKVEKLIRGYEKETKKSIENMMSLPDHDDPKKEEAMRNSIFFEHSVIDSVFRSKNRPQSIRDLLAKPIEDRSDPGWVKSLKKEILTFIEDEKRALTPQRRAELEKEKQRQEGLEPEEAEAEGSNDREA